MRILVIGCGYVGLPLAVRLAREGHEAFGLRRTAVTDDAMTAAGIKPLQADISEPTQIARLPSPFDWVVNCVSSSHGGIEDYRRVYLEGTRNLVEWLSAAPPQKFVYTSSTSVYGQDDGSVVTEESPTEPGTETGKVLLEAEQILLEASRNRGFPAMVLRVAGIYGPERGYWLKRFLEQGARLEGDGIRYLNMVHRDDVVSAVIAALGSGRAGEIYNVVDDEPVSQLTLFKWLSEKLRRPLPPTAGEPAAEARQFPSKRAATNKRVSNGKLKAELGYRFQYPTFREGFEGIMAPQRAGRTSSRRGLFR